MVKKTCSSFDLLGEMSKLGIVGGCIYEYQRVVDWRACFQVARNGPGDHVDLRYVYRQ